jgi:type IV pilus assembly protein PilE
MSHAMNRRSATGFTLIELMLAIAIVAILAAIAYPAFQGPLFKARRSDGLVALMQLQVAQERWHSNHGRYATLTELGAAATSPSRHYQIAVEAASALGFEAVATATGLQARDRVCKVMLLSVSNGHTQYASGADAGVGNGAADNRRCWNL